LSLKEMTRSVNNKYIKIDPEEMANIEPEERTQQVITKKMKNEQ